jgi:hypothetical protein
MSWETDYDGWKATEPDPLPTRRFGVDVIMNVTVDAIDFDHARQLAEETAKGMGGKNVDYIEVSSIQEL